jgi:hypothetical protein
LRFLGGFVLLLGLAGAVLLYQGGVDQTGLDPNDPTGVTWPLAPEDFKVYSRNMEMFGGKLWVLVERARRYVAGQWRRNGPALLLAAGSLAVAGLLFHAAGPPPEGTGKDGRPGQG